MTFRLKPQAEADIEAILQHIMRESPAAAWRWLDDVRACCRRLGDFPRSGVERADIRPGLRIAVCGHYLVLHCAVEGAVEIVRVLHGARDWQAHLDMN